MTLYRHRYQNRRTHHIYVRYNTLSLYRLSGSSWTGFAQHTSPTWIWEKNSNLFTRWIRNKIPPLDLVFAHPILLASGDLSWWLNPYWCLADMWIRSRKSCFDENPGAVQLKDSKTIVKQVFTWPSLLYVFVPWCLFTYEKTKLNVKQLNAHIGIFVA